MSSTSLQAIKAASVLRSVEERTQASRRRDALVLILAHLRQSGLSESATALVKEAPFLNSFEVADNVHLVALMSIFAESQEAKGFNRPLFSRRVDVGSSRKDVSENCAPAIARKIPSGQQEKHLNASRRRIAQKYGTDGSNPRPLVALSQNSANIQPHHAVFVENARQEELKKCKSRIGGTDQTNTEREENPVCDALQGKACGRGELDDKARTQNDIGTEEEVNRENITFLTNPYPNESSLHDLANAMSSEIVQKSLDVKWGDIVELEGTRPIL
jgi:hypothetical protein